MISPLKRFKKEPDRKLNRRERRYLAAKKRKEDERSRKKD